MLTLPSNVSIRLYRNSVNMGLSFDGLIGLVRNAMLSDPTNGTLFVFRNRIGDKLKILYWDNDGFALWYKRLESGTFLLPVFQDETNTATLTRAQLSMLLEGLSFANVRQRKRFSKKSA